MVHHGTCLLFPAFAYCNMSVWSQPAHGRNSVNVLPCDMMCEYTLNRTEVKQSASLQRHTKHVIYSISHTILTWLLIQNIKNMSYMCSHVQQNKRLVRTVGPTASESLYIMKRRDCGPGGFLRDGRNGAEVEHCTASQPDRSVSAITHNTTKWDDQPSASK